MGVFATRSPFRPNPIGMSCVRLEEILQEEGKGPVLVVSGGDMMDGTPVYDIKPYLPYTDAYPDADGGWTSQIPSHHLQVELSDKLEEMVPDELREALREILAQDPRPSYQRDEERIYGMRFAGLEVRFCVEGNCLTVCSIQRE